MAEWRDRALAVLRAPLGRRARHELLFCLVMTIPVGLVYFAAPTAAAMFAATATGLTEDSAAWTAVAMPLLAGMLLGLVMGTARPLGAAYRRLAGLLLGERIAAPPPPGQGVLSRLRDGPSWRAAAFLLLQIPLTAAALYALLYWGAGLANMTYPLWWPGFRNHPPNVHLSPVPVITPFGSFGVATYPGTFAAFAAGGGMLLAAPWVTRAVAWVYRRLARGLLGAGTLMQRVKDLERSRALAVDDSAALLRHVERNLHDGAQIRLATLALNLGMAREKLDGDPDGVAAARELLDVAHRGAKDALSELRELVKGFHPPILDNGLADALETLVTDSALPVELRADVPDRPTPAIETIAYFCAAELLANAVKHSHANKIGIEVAERAGRRLLLTVTDDGIGGADAALGTGLAGLAQRVKTVDGRLEIESPPGGPTRISVHLPLRA